MMKVIRFWMPAAILVAGIALVVVRGGDETSLEGCAALWGAGLSVALLNWLHRMGVSGDRSRVQEDEARAYFAQHGRWPDEDGATGGGGAASGRRPSVPPRQGS